jgi:hypothetical protein
MQNSATWMIPWLTNNSRPQLNLYFLQILINSSSQSLEGTDSQVHNQIIVDADSLLSWIGGPRICKKSEAIFSPSTDMRDKELNNINYPLVKGTQKTNGIKQLSIIRTKIIHCDSKTNY